MCRAAFSGMARGRKMQFASGALGPDMSCSGLAAWTAGVDERQSLNNTSIKHEATNKAAQRGTTGRVEASSTQGTALGQSKAAGAWRAVADGQTREEGDRYMPYMQTSGYGLHRVGFD
jgi:hypothetical protein